VSWTFAVVLAVGVLNYVPDLGRALRSMANALAPDGVVIINVPTAERAAGTRYRRLELLGRRRIWCRTRAEVEGAARRAGLRLDAGPRTAGVTDLYVLRANQARSAGAPEDLSRIVAESSQCGRRFS
jgi:SAM-dependent methyltransferase